MTFDNLLSGLFGAIVGGLAGGFLAYLATARTASNQRRITHRAAVRAVLYELSQELPKLDPNYKRNVILTSSAYDGLLIPLYTDLPDGIAHHVSLAYAMFHVTGSTYGELNPTEKELVRSAATNAQTNLRLYAELVLKLRFLDPSPPR